MNRINPRKLLGSKWTAVRPQNKEKHFLVSQIIKEEETIVACVLEAVYSKNETTLPWQDLQNTNTWLFGWK
jgi:tryptophan-rich hypothetical protein